MNDQHHFDAGPGMGHNQMMNRGESRGKDICPGGDAMPELPVMRPSSGNRVPREITLFGNGNGYGNSYRARD